MASMILRECKPGDRYGRKDNHGIAHYLTFASRERLTWCEFHVDLVYKLQYDDDSVTEHATCLWCVCLE